MNVKIYNSFLNLKIYENISLRLPIRVYMYILNFYQSFLTPIDRALLIVSQYRSAFTARSWRAHDRYVLVNSRCQLWVYETFF